MAKRHTLDYNNSDLVHNLKASRGRGADAFFEEDAPPSVQNAPTEEVRESDTYTNAAMHERVHASTPAPKDAQVHARGANPHDDTIQALRDQIRHKKHLSSFTFRFRSEELERLARATEQINDERDQKVSKNDIVRLAVNQLLHDFEENFKQSVLARVLRDL